MSGCLPPFLRRIFCCSPPAPPAQAPSQPSGGTGNEPDQSLTYARLKEDVVREHEREPRLKPFLTLFTLIEDPNIDFTSTDVQDFLDELATLGKDLEPGIPPKLTPTIELFFPDDPSIERVRTDEFSNWGQTVEYHTPYTFVVRSVAGVQKVVRWAAGEGRKVRVSGFRHSWTEVFGATGDVMIMFQPYDTLTQLPYKPAPKGWQSELVGIDIISQVAGRDAPEGHSFCKIMAGTTNDEFRQWCYDNKKWCIPLNVIMVEVTFGGTNAPICHGAGLSTGTLSDIVVEVVYIDAKGALQIVNDPKELVVASGAFGMLGVVVSVTVQLDAMNVTDMMPVKLPLPLAIPPPADYTIPHQVLQQMEELNITDKMLEDAREAFVARFDVDYYLEWFWFPYQSDVWVNTWSKRPAIGADGKLLPYPNPGWLQDGVKSQQLQGDIAEAVVNYTPFRWLPGRLQAFLFGAASMFTLPDIKDPSKAIKTFQSEALHFRRGIQNFRCWDTEWEIPVPTTAVGTIDYSLIQRAWWDGISAIYSRKDAPVRIALEMRMTGYSNVLLAPQRGNTCTASIECLTTLITPKDDWATFMQVLADKWTSYEVVKDAKGNTLYPRPHWAKQFAGLQVHGKPVERYLEEDAYKDSFAEFRQGFEGIVTLRGSTVEETFARFGNGMMERLIWGR